MQIMFLSKSLQTKSNADFFPLMHWWVFEKLKLNESPSLFFFFYWSCTKLLVICRFVLCPFSTDKMEETMKQQRTSVYSVCVQSLSFRPINSSLHDRIRGLLSTRNIYFTASLDLGSSPCIFGSLQAVLKRARKMSQAPHWQETATDADSVPAPLLHPCPARTHLHPCCTRVHCSTVIKFHSRQNGSG